MLGTSTGHYGGSFQNIYQYYALGRRISETVIHLDSSQTQTIQTTTDLYYDWSGDVIQEDQSTPTTSPSVLNQYVWTPVEKGMMILRDSTDGNGPGPYGASHLDQSVWAMQSPDGSTMQIVLEHSCGQDVKNYTEEYVYDPSGQASIVRYNVVNLDYDFWINSVYGWRYLWRGGRAGQDQIPPAGDDPTQYAAYLDVFDGTYLMPDGFRQFRHGRRGGRDAPLQSDKYAFFRDPTNSSDINQYQYGTRSYVNATYGYNGTTSNFDDLKR